MKAQAAVVAGFVLLTSPSFSAESLSEAKAEFVKHDKALNLLYAKMKREMDPAAFARVQADQRIWLEHRDYIAEWEGAAQGRKPAETASYWSMAAVLTESRVTFPASLGDWGAGGHLDGPVSGFLRRPP